jgi:tetratricopeptide (TPR) repeat protein
VVRPPWVAMMAITLLLLPPSARATWDYVPTAIEWQMWPVYCRVQWSYVNGGLDYQNRRAYSDSDFKNWRAMLGDYTFETLHHYCKSIHDLIRAREAPDVQNKHFLLNRAWGDAQFTYIRSDPQSPVYPNISVTFAQIEMEMGRSDDAMDVLRNAIAAQPQRPEPYIFLAVTYRKQKKLDLALKVLEDADAAVGGGSAEIQYNLGVISLEMGNVDAAAAYARRAYSNGYPLDSLKNKLRQMGRWKDGAG